MMLGLSSLLHSGCEIALAGSCKRYRLYPGSIELSIEPAIQAPDHPVLLHSLPVRHAWVDCAILLALGAHLLNVWWPTWIIRALSVDSPADLWIANRLLDLAAIALVAFALLRISRLPLASLAIDCARPYGQIGVGIGAGVIAFLLSQATIGVAEQMHGWMGGGTRAPNIPEDDIFRELIGARQFGRIVAMFVISVIAEELYLRGLVYPRVRRILGSWGWSNVVCAVLFAYAHVPMGGPYPLAQFVLSLVLGVLFSQTRSLLTVIVAHLVSNGALVVGSELGL